MCSKVEGQKQQCSETETSEQWGHLLEADHRLCWPMTELTGWHSWCLTVISIYRRSWCCLHFCFAELCVALYSYSSDEPGDLVFQKGDVIKVLRAETDWWRGSLNGRTGDFPANYVSKMTSAVCLLMDDTFRRVLYW